MDIVRASVMGFCMGVRRAVEAAEKTIEEYKGKDCKMFSLGPLIHNPAVLEEFRKDGMEVLEESNLAAVKEGCPVVIRAHGTCPQIVETLEKKGAVVIDATCPRVRQSQIRVREWSQKGYSVVVAGDKNHGEVTGISGYFDENCGGQFYVVQSEEDAAKISVSGKLMLLAQTTFSFEKYEKIKNVLIKIYPEIKIFDSICPATKERQKALLELKGAADGILVIGGKNSANTKRLFESAEKIYSRAALIEEPDEIPQDFFELGKVALTAGASTPDWIIDRVEKALVDKLK